MSRPEPEISPAVPGDAALLAAVLNADDRREIEALSGRDPAAVILEGIGKSTEAWTGRIGGEIVCVCGVGPASAIGETGVPWLLGSDLVQAHASVFLRQSRLFVRRWAGLFPVLHNVVDARHTRAVRWLRWLGFEILPARPMGVQNLPFHSFVLRT